MAVMALKAVKAATAGPRQVSNRFSENVLKSRLIKQVVSGLHVLVCFFGRLQHLMILNIKGCSRPLAGLGQDLQEPVDFGLYQKRFRAIPLIQLILRNKARHDFRSQCDSMQKQFCSTLRDLATNVLRQA